MKKNKLFTLFLLLPYTAAYSNNIKSTEQTDIPLTQRIQSNRIRITLGCAANVIGFFAIKESIRFLSLSEVQHATEMTKVKEMLDYEIFKKAFGNAHTDMKTAISPLVNLCSHKISGTAILGVSGAALTYAGIKTLHTILFKKNNTKLKGL